MEIPSGGRARTGRAKKIAEENLKLAQGYFLSNFNGQLEEDIIFEIAYLISPTLGPVVSYRNEGDSMTRSLDDDPIIYPNQTGTILISFINKIFL